MHFPSDVLLTADNGDGKVEALPVAKFHLTRDETTKKPVLLRWTNYFLQDWKDQIMV